MISIDNSYTASGRAVWQKEQGTAEKPDSKKSEKSASVKNRDQAEFSTVGLEAVREWKIGSELKSAIPDEDFMAQLKAVREKTTKLEADWDSVVDPGGRISAITYAESVIRQYENAKNTIIQYYNKEHQDNLSRPTQADGLLHISAKYSGLGRELNSPYYRADMSEEERMMAMQQERALMLGGSINMKDPYALAFSGGILNIENVDKIARQAVRDKLDELRREWEQNNPPVNRGKYE